MAVLYVGSDREGAGKTSLCAALASTFERRGTKAVVVKPLGGADSDPDPGIYRKLLNQSVEGWPVALSDWELTPKSLNQIKAVVDRGENEAEIVVVEGSCGLSGESSAQLADALDAKVLVLARYRRDLSVDELKRWQGTFGERLMGFVINGLTRYLGTEARGSLLPAMESEGLVSFGILPEDQRMLGVSVRQVAEHLQGRFVACEERSDALVEHLMVGGMGMDPGEPYFGVRQDKAVIVRGDRPDIQMAALNTPTACLVLTKDVEPIEYVKYEAEQEEVSVIVVESDTLETMNRLGTLMECAQFDHPVKLGRFVEMVEEHLDLPALFGALGLET